jgi:hypothetical protein
MHPLKVLQLLPRQRRQRFHQPPVGRVAKQQTKGVARRFFLAVGVIQQDKVEVTNGLVDPGRRSRRGQL